MHLEIKVLFQICTKMAFAFVKTWKREKCRSTVKKNRNFSLLTSKVASLLQFWECHIVKENLRKLYENLFFNTFVGGENCFLLITSEELTALKL